MKRENTKTVELTNQLADLVEEFKNTDKYLEYLRFASSFKGYSWTNTMLLFMQKPDVSYVKGMKQWNKLGRRVKAGEKALYIFAPLIGKKKEIDDETKEEKETDVCYGYRSVPVFDVSQTDGKELATAATLINKLEGDIDNFDELVSQISSATTATVSFSNESKHGEKGYFNIEENAIIVNTDNNSKFQQLKTLCHEVAHSLLHNKEAQELTTFTSSQKECEAESVAYVVMHSLGYNTEEYSLGYLAGWEGLEKDLIRKSLNRISKCANTILENIQQEKTTTTM